VSFEVVAGGRPRVVNAHRFRLQLGASVLRSTWIESAEVAGGNLVVRGRGWGHGVGLCQMGAKGMAESGHTVEHIVSRYYPGAQVMRLW
jgi:stage II sporulation protein D